MGSLRHLWLAVLVLVAVATSGGWVWADERPGLPRSPEEALAAGYERLVVRVDFPTVGAMRQITYWVEPWEVDLEKGFLIVDVGPEGYQRLVDLGFEPELLSKPTVRLNTPFAALPGQRRGIPSFPCYRTVEETLATGAALAAAHPTLASWIDIGDSWEKSSPGGLPGYDLMVLKLTNSAIAGPKPVLWVEGAIHARELVSPETVTRYAEHLLANYGTDPDITWILDHHEIHALLVTNPDGRKHAETGLSWRKNTNENYCGPTSNDRGADLNRNFDFEWGCCGGSSGDPCWETYRGPSASSDPETQAVQNYVASVIPDQRPDDLVTPAGEDTMGVFIDVHSHGGDVFTPFGFQTPPAPNDTQMLTLARKYAYFTGYEARLGSAYPVDGTTKDWAYGRLGVPAFTFELGTRFDQQCAPFESTIYPDNLQTLLYAAKAVRRPYTQPAGPDAVSVTAHPNVVAPGDPVLLTAVADDTRYEPGSGEPSQHVVAAEIYLDVPPWGNGATAAAMVPVDGSFDSAIESVEGVLNTAGLADGRHTVFVRAQDAAGHWGVVSAAFLWIVDPDTAGHLVGTVTSLEDGTPLTAEVSAGVFVAATDPADGGYELLVPPGVYDVTARADGFGPLTVENVDLSTGSPVAMNLQLAPIEAIFFDDVEAGNQGWTAEGQWSITEGASHSPTHSWTDSAGGYYGDGWNVSLISAPLDLSGLSGTELEFMHRYAIEDLYDYGYVEVSDDDGVSWSQVESYTGFQGGWARVSVQLPQLDGASAARIRFRLETDGSVTDDGWYVDDITIRAAAPGAVGDVFADGFESGDSTGWSATVP
jgi:hypothetical protein